MLRHLPRCILPDKLYWPLRRCYVSIGRRILTQKLDPNTRRLIIFLTPAINHPSGGILSIASLLCESRRLKQIHGAEVIWCTLPGDIPLLKYTWFNNRLYLRDLDFVLRSCPAVESLLLHIPEYAVNRLADWISTNWNRFFERIGQRQFNVMLQNIDLLSGQNISALKAFGRVTCTTAHEAYTTEEIRQQVGVPMHKMSVFLSPEQYKRSGYREKENLLIYSPDEHPLKTSIIRQLAENYPKLKLQMVSGLSYEQYKQLIRRAKWSLTFGEGLDGYFAEPIFSGGVSFAVFNDRFFTPSFANLENVYASWEVLQNRIVDDLRRLDQSSAYNECWNATYNLLADLYDVKAYRENLRQFYLCNYTFP